VADEEAVHEKEELKARKEAASSVASRREELRDVDGDLEFEPDDDPAVLQPKGAGEAPGMRSTEGGPPE
jgi:hypothetical protein